MKSELFNIEKVRAQFPALNREVEGPPPVFFDNPGGTQTPQSVIDAVTEHLLHSNCNLLNSSFYGVERTYAVVGEARASAAAFLNCDPHEIVFGHNMSTMTAHMSRSISRNWQPGDEIIVTALDHFANVSFWRQAAEDRGVTCHTARINPEDCTLDEEHLESLISSKTKLVAFTLGANLCGSLTDAKRIIKAARAVGAVTYVDAVHYAPHCLPDVQDLDCDFLVSSPYKYFGTHMGLLFGKKEKLESLRPYKLAPAPEHAPDKWETGTKNFEDLAGFSAAIKYLASFSKNNNLRRSLEESYEVFEGYEQAWSKRFLEQAQNIKGLEIKGITDMARLEHRTATFAMTLEGYSVREVAEHLVGYNICVCAGCCYANGITDALGLTDSGGIFRVGATHYNTFEEMDRLFEVLDQMSSSG